MNNIEQLDNIDVSDIRETVKELDSALPTPADENLDQWMERGDYSLSDVFRMLCEAQRCFAQMVQQANDEV